MTAAGIQCFIDQCRYGTLSTVSAAGTAQSAVVGTAVTDRLEIIFDTVNTSRKYPNLIARADCSFVFWAGERTVQYEGKAQQLQSPELERYQQTYFGAFPDGPQRLSWPGIVYFVVKPTWLRYSDFLAQPVDITEFKFDPDHGLRSPCLARTSRS